MKVRDLIKLLQKHGWYEVRQRGSHKQFKYPEKPGIITIAGKPNDDIALGTLNSILKHAGPKGGKLDA